MGSLFSCMVWRGSSDAGLLPETGLGDLPESCVASVLVYLDPPEICRMAMLNRAFREASLADFVWESKLPSNYGDIIDKVFEEGDGFCNGLCKRDIYFGLCRPNPLMVAPRFSSVAYLQQTGWFEVDGEIDFPFPAGSYSLFFRLQLGRTHRRSGRLVWNPEHVHGWDRKPVWFHLSTPDGQRATKQHYLSSMERGKWAHLHGGDFTVREKCRSMRVKFSMTQIDGTHSKGGLWVDSVLIYPAEYRERL